MNVQNDARIRSKRVYLKAKNYDYDLALNLVLKVNCNDEPKKKITDINRKRKTE